MTEALRTRLATPEVLLMDGGTGGALQDRGVDVDNPLWASSALFSEEGRRLNRQLHADYRSAGADLLIANTHNASLSACAAYLESQPGLPDLSLPEAVLEHVHRAALADARAEAKGAFVAGCLASPDRPYATQASLTPQEVTQGLSAQFEVQCGLSFDLVIFEMLTTRADVRGVARLDISSAPMCGAGLVCGQDGRLLDGFDVSEAARCLADAGVAVVFIQCTRYDIALEALTRLAPLADAFEGIGVYANDARTWAGGQWCGSRVDPATYRAHAEQWVRAGAKLVGGCCGTGPEHIAALRSPSLL